MEDPTAQSPPDQARPRIVKGSPEMFDLNILPERHRRKRLTFVVILPWLILLILLGTAYPTYTMAAESQRIFQENRLSLAKTQVRLDFFQENSQVLESLKAQIDERQAERDRMLESFAGLELSSENWGPALFQIRNAIPEGIALSYLSRQENSYRLEGVASQYGLVVVLADSLAELPTISGVEIERIEQIDGEDALVLPTGSRDPEAEVPGPAAYYEFAVLFNATGEVQP